MKAYLPSDPVVALAAIAETGEKIPLRWMSVVPTDDAWHAAWRTTRDPNALVVVTFAMAEPPRWLDDVLVRVAEYLFRSHLGRLQGLFQRYHELSAAGASPVGWAQFRSRVDRLGQAASVKAHARDITPHAHEILRLLVGPPSDPIAQARAPAILWRRRVYDAVVRLMLNGLTTLHDELTIARDLDRLLMALRLFLRRPTLEELVTRFNTPRKD